MERLFEISRYAVVHPYFHIIMGALALVFPQLVGSKILAFRENCGFICASRT